MLHLDLRDPDRVRARTAASVNARIDAAARQRVGQLPDAALPGRLSELDHEWTVDRAVMLSFVALGGLTFALGVRTARQRRRGWNAWLTLFSTQLAFLGYHALRGWCPPVPVLRRLGFRTSREIEAERHEVAARLAALLG